MKLPEHYTIYIQGMSLGTFAVHLVTISSGLRVRQSIATASLERPGLKGGRKTIAQSFTILYSGLPSNPATHENIKSGYLSEEVLISETVHFQWQS